MALYDLFGWKNTGAANACASSCGTTRETPAACGLSCGAGEGKPAETPAACGAADQPEPAPTACGSACGAGDK